MWKNFKKIISNKGDGILVGALIFGYIAWMIWTLSDGNSIIMNIVFGVASSLFGAIVGGFFSFAANAYVGDQQMKMNMEIKIRDEIYLPLYVEISYIYGKYKSIDNMKDKTDEIICTEWEKIKYSASVIGISEEIIRSFKILSEVTKEFLDNNDNDKEQELWERYKNQCNNTCIKVRSYIQSINKKYIL